MSIKIIVRDDRDHPWVNYEFKKMIKRKNWLFQSQRKSCKLDFPVLNSLTQDTSDAITSSKLKYYESLANKLNDHKTAPKTYWKILKTFVNSTKIPLIPPLLLGNQLVSDFLEKANVRMIKMCASSTGKPLAILFRNCLESECFPKEWKKANIVPVHKKHDKQLIKNYRPVSLLPICSKIFEKVIFNSLFKYLDDNNLLNSNQSGFWPGDSCVHQLLSITHEIYKAFDANPSLDVRGVFLDL